MVNPIPQKIKEVWAHWNIRGVILFSLSLQIFLIFFAPLRKRTQAISLMATMWSAYLLADYAANYCVGLISNSQLDALESSKSAKTIINTNSDLLAFWAPFLLLHLGGPDTITALALEDNELWLRHLLGLISQVGTAAYIFLLSMPGNVLWLPTVLVFIAGMIKYAERTCSMYLGSLDNFRETTHGKPNAGPNYPMLMDKYRTWRESGIPTRFVDMPDRHEISHETTATGTTRKDNDNEIGHVEVVQKAFYFFNKFKGLISDMIFTLSDRNESRKYFSGLSANDALRVIEVELNFLYEAFYTKFLVVRSWFGFILRFVATILITSTLAIFHSVDKEKYGFDGFDVRVTYALLGGGVGLDFLAFFMLIFSDRTLVYVTKFPQVRYWLQNKAPMWVRSWLKKKGPEWKWYNKEPYNNTSFKMLSTTIFFRRWNGSMAGFNLIKHCLDQCSKKKNILIQCYHFVKRQYLQYFGFGYSRNPFFKEVWEHIFAELKQKSDWATDVRRIHTICDARGAWVMKKELTEKLPELEEAKKKSLLSFVDADEVAFDESLILWHIATHLCCSWEESQHKDEDSDQNQTGEHQHQDQTQPEKNQSQGQNQTGEHQHQGQTQPEENQSQDQNQLLAILWAIATYPCRSWKESQHKSQHRDQILPEEKQSPDQNQSHQRLISKLIADYMMYLLIFQTKLISSVAGIGIKRFQDTCEEATKFFEERELPAAEETDSQTPGKSLENHNEMESACRRLGDVHTDIRAIDIKGDESKSLLFDACRLAKDLMELKEDLRWRIISKVWVEMLSFAATNCRPTAHVQQLCKGGELISLVWLLMVRLGLGKQFQIKEARLKLVVGKRG